MATGHFTPTTHAVLIPESWKKDAILELYQAMVMRNLINEVQVEEGLDTLHFPNIAKLAAEAITPGTALVGKVNTETQTDLVINKSYGVPISISKQTMKQAQKNISILDLYRKRAAEALAWQIDQHLLGLYSGLSQEVACSGDLSVAKLTEARRVLNKAAAPQNDRHLVISPEQEEALLNISNFIEAAKFGNAQAVQNGAIGRVFGFWVWVTDAVLTSTTRKNLAFHRDFAALGVQMEIEFDIAFNVLGQCWDLVASVLYGYVEMRDTFAAVVTTTD